MATKDFKEVWKVLKTKGWKAKQPSARGVETKWSYIPPGGSLSGVRKTDFFLGEDELLAHYGKHTSRNLVLGDV